MMYRPALLFIFVTLFTGLALIAGCSTFDPEYERDNPRDPKGTNFVQSEPTTFTVNIEDSIIDISWVDVSDYNSGYIVEKAIDDSTRFEQVALLPKDAERYRDETGEVGLVNYYKISMFVGGENDRTIVQSKTLSISITAFNSVSVYSPGKNEMSIGWEVEGQFTDGVLIEEKSRYGGDYKTVETIDLDSQESLYGNYRYNTDLETFNLDVRVTAFQYRDGGIVPIQQYVDRLSINNPENIEVTFVNELETRIGWEHRVNYVDHYLVNVRFSESGRQLSYELLPNQIPATLDMEMESGNATYTVQAVKGDDKGSEKEIRRNFNIRIPNLGYTSTSLDALTLQFDKYWDGPARYSAIKVDRSTNGTGFEEIVSLPATATEYTDSDVITGNTYEYRIRTLTDVGYPTIELSEKNRFVPIENIQVETINTLEERNVHFLSEDEFAYYRTHYSNQASTDLEIINTSDMSSKGGFDSGSDYYESRVAPTGDTVVQFVDGERFGEYDLKIWDLNTNTLLRTISAAHVETSITDIFAKLDVSRDGRLVASTILANRGTEISIWNSATGELIQNIEFPGDPLGTYLFNPEKDEFIVSTKSGVYIYDTESLNLLHELENPFSDSSIRMQISGNGERVLLYNYGRFAILDTETRQIIEQGDFGGSTNWISTNRDGSLMLVADYEELSIYSISPFDLKYVLKYNYGNSNRDFLMLNSMKDGEAIQIERGDLETPATITKWESRDVWYMDQERQ